MPKKTFIVQTPFRIHNFTVYDRIASTFLYVVHCVFPPRSLFLRARHHLLWNTECKVRHSCNYCVWCLIQEKTIQYLSKKKIINEVDSTVLCVITLYYPGTGEREGLGGLYPPPLADGEGGWGEVTDDISHYIDIPADLK